MAKADLNPAFIDYDGVTTYLNQSKDEYITEKLKYKKETEEIVNYICNNIRNNEPYDITKWSYRNDSICKYFCIIGRPSYILY